MDASRSSEQRRLKEYEKLRHRMVEEQLVSRGIRDPLVLRAFRMVPREFFVPSFLKNSAYKDAPLPIGRGQSEEDILHPVVGVLHGLQRIQLWADSPEELHRLVDQIPKDFVEYLQSESATGYSEHEEVKKVLSQL